MDLPPRQIHLFHPSKPAVNGPYSRKACIFKYYFFDPLFMSCFAAQHRS